MRISLSSFRAVRGAPGGVNPRDLDVGTDRLVQLIDGVLGPLSRAAHANPPKPKARLCVGARVDRSHRIPRTAPEYPPVTLDHPIGRWRCAGSTPARHLAGEFGYALLNSGSGQRTSLPKTPREWSSRNSRRRWTLMVGTNR